MQLTTFTLNLKPAIELINPQDQQVEIYRSGQPIEALDRLDPLSGETGLPEFILDLREIWN